MNTIKQLTLQTIELISLYTHKGCLLFKLWLVKRNKTSKPEQPQTPLLPQDNYYDPEDPWTY